MDQVQGTVRTFMNSFDRKLAKTLATRLAKHDATVQKLPGIGAPAALDTLVDQLIESCRRIRFVETLQTLNISPRRADPADLAFDPLRAAAYHHKQGNVDEACWLVFLATHSALHRVDRWNLCRRLYLGDGGGRTWTWNRVSGNPGAFRKWLSANVAALKTKPGSVRFGNHRKYQTLQPSSVNGTGTADAVESYVRWINSPGGHAGKFQQATHAAGNDPFQAFDALYAEMQCVASFGRTARFDYLTMIGNQGLAKIKPGRTYLTGASGPLIGAKLLFKNAETAQQLEKRLQRLDQDLKVGGQVLEDSLCNWQKSPTKFIPFRG